MGLRPKRMWSTLRLGHPVRPLKLAAWHMIGFATIFVCVAIALWMHRLPETISMARSYSAPSGYSRLLECALRSVGDALSWPLEQKFSIFHGRLSIMYVERWYGPMWIVGAPIRGCVAAGLLVNVFMPLGLGVVRLSTWRRFGFRHLFRGWALSWPFSLALGAWWLVVLALAPQGDWQIDYPDAMWWVFAALLATLSTPPAVWWSIFAYRYAELRMRVVIGLGALACTFAAWMLCFL